MSDEPSQHDPEPQRLPPEGWFPDPERPGKLRWWDGEQWTEHRTDDPALQLPADAPKYDGPTKTSGWATASLVLGILGGVLPAILCGVIAKDRIRKSGGALTGDGIATAGIVLGSIWAVVFIIAFALPSLETNEDPKFTGSKQAIAEVVERVENALADDHGDEACAELFTTAFAAKLARGTGMSCAAAVDSSIEDGQLQSEIEVETIVLRGNVARARVREGTDEETWRLRRHGSRWLVDAIDAGR